MPDDIVPNATAFKTGQELDTQPLAASDFLLATQHPAHLKYRVTCSISRACETGLLRQFSFLTL
jgi:hypothetical protein